MPLITVVANGTNMQLINTDYIPVPHGGDTSFVYCLLECLRFIGRKSGLSMAQADQLVYLVRFNLLKVALNDLTATETISMPEHDVINLALKATAKFAGDQSVAEEESVISAKQLLDLIDTCTALQRKLDQHDEMINRIPRYGEVKEDSIADACDWSWFGRIRRDTLVENLAGVAPVPPIMRPIELTLVPDKVSHFLEVSNAMRHCLNLCVLLANQKDLVRNSYTLRICLIQHLFLRVIPLPLPMNHSRRETDCFWHAQPMRYETQADILRLLNMICRHFATASLSVRITRSGDAIRMLVFACMATICDATLRKTACDIPSQSSLHYSGEAKGPVKPFGFDLGNFAEESEYLKFTTPESTAARTQVLDYFHDLNKLIPPDHLIFKFDAGLAVHNSDKLFIDQLCLQMGFQRGLEKEYISGKNSVILDHYPEIGFFRDLVFMFKLVMVPTSDKLPELKAWMPEEAALVWGLDGDNYTIKGFGKSLDCTQIVESVQEEQVKREKKSRGFISRLLRYVGVKGTLPRATPSQANPSILLGERVDTEDDILHIRNLPDFEGSLGARDCELMLQYLTAPYLRIPLLLHFFSNEGRLKALRNKGIQEVLDAALFEPGQWQEDQIKICPTEIPAETRNHLCTVVGLLFNEVIMSPNIILASVKIMLEKVIEMDTGKYSEISEAILYVIRLAVRVEGFIYFLTRNRQFHKKKDTTLSKSGRYNGAYTESEVRGFQDCDDQTEMEAVACQLEIRNILNDKIFKILARWITKAKADGKMFVACMLHAHLAYLFRNVQKEDLTPTIVFSTLASQVFLFNNYKYDLDLEKNDKVKQKDRKDTEQYKDDLGIPQVELFDMFQRNRNKIMEWLLQNQDDRNTVSFAFLVILCSYLRQFGQNLGDGCNSAND